MAQYILKSALVAEIENWKQYTLECGYKGQGDYEDGNKQGRLDTCDKFLSFIETIEVKEVDLKKEIDDAFLENKCNITDNVSFGEFKRIAKHFFELGMAASNKAQKGE